MDVVPFSEVLVADQDGRLVHLGGLRLNVPHLLPGLASLFVALVEEVRQFDYVERKVLVIECGAPVLDHRGEQSGIFISSFDIGFALVPDHALEVEVYQWRDHSAVEGGRDVVEEHHRRRLRHRGAEVIFPFVGEFDFFISEYELIWLLVDE